MQILRKIIHITRLLPIILCTACMGEGDMDCDQLAADGLTIQFLHTINPQYTNTLPSVIEHIDLYIYKENGDLFRHVNLTKAELEKTSYRYNTYLPAGVYKLAAWMNNGDHFLREETHDFSNAGTRIVCGNTWEIRNDTEPLFYGYVDRQYAYEYEEEDTIVEMGENPVHININFAKNTNYLRIDTQFDRVIHMDGDVKVELRARNGVCNFYNRQYRNQTREDSQPRVYTYYPHSTEEAFQESGYYYTHTSRLTTQRLWEGDENEISIILQEPGRQDKVLITESLTNLLMQNPAFDNSFKLERYDNYRIIFQFNLEGGNWVLAEILVNDWHLIHQEENPGIGYE